MAVELFSAHEPFMAASFSNVGNWFVRATILVAVSTIG